MLEKLYGNLIDLAEQGSFDVIVHGCNCFCTMESGIAREIKSRYPEAYRVDWMTKPGDVGKLGCYTQYKTDKGFTIVNAYTQYDYGTDKIYFSYDAFKEVLKKLENDFPEETRFGFPLIGCGLAGGDKDKVISMLEEFSEKRNTKLVLFFV